MKIDAISFKGVYSDTNKQFSPAQYQISERIKERLTSPDYEDKRGYTPDEKLKKQGFDVILSPSEETSVDVSVVTNLKKGIGVQPHTYSKRIYVGTYDKQSEFSPNDIYSTLNKGNIHWKELLAVPIIAILAMLGGTVINDCTNKEKNVQNIENNVLKDTIQDSVKTVPADTLKLIRK